MTFRRRLLLVLTCTLGTIGCDQATKRLAVDHLRDTPGMSLLGGVVQLRHAENSGGFLSFGASLTPALRFALFTVAVGLLLVGMLVAVVLSSRMHVLERLALVALAAGGLSNWIDRVTNDGRVVDFLILQGGPLRTGVFNVADVVIMAAIPLWLWRSKRRATERVERDLPN